MSELIAEARVLVTPDTTAFRGLLTQQVTSAASGVVVPVAVAPVFTGAGTATAALVTQQQALGAAATGTTTALLAEDAALSTLVGTQTGAAAAARGGVVLATQQQVALEKVAAAQAAGVEASRRAAAAATEEARARRVATAAAADQARTLTGVARGAGASALSLVGLRGATLASTGPFLAGAAAIATFVASVKLSSGLETSLNVFNATAEATAEEMERISELSRQLGADLTLPGVTAGSAADALSQLARAGLSVKDATEGVRGTLQLATAAAIDNETAVTLVANALNAFRLQGSDAAKVADLLAASSKQSQGSIEDMGLALAQAASAAAQAGISVEDTVAVLTQLGRAGLRGSDAGTSFRTAILRIINPSKQAKEAIEGLGVTLRDIDGNIRPEVFAEIATQAAKLGPAARDATIALIGGQDAFRAISILGRDGAAGLNDMRDATQEVGVAADLASARTQGLAGAAENLKNQLGAVGLSIGDALNTPLTDFVNILGDGFKNINTFIGWLDRSDDQAKTTGVAYHNLAIRAAEVRAAHGDKQANELLDRLESDIGQVSLAYTNAVIEAGKFNRAVAERGDSAGEGLLEAAREANKALEEQASAALKASDSIEGYRINVTLAAEAVEGLTNRIDESTDRFATTLPEPTAPPNARKRVSGLQGQVDLAESEGDIREVERLQEKILANAIKAERDGIHKSVKERQRLFDERVAAQVALNNTRKRIAADGAADAKDAAREVARRQKEADEAFLQGQEDARARQERQVTIASATPGLKDDIREQKQSRDLIQKQIAAIKASSLDEKTKQAALRVLRAERDKTTDAINELKRTDAEQRAAAQEQRNEERVALAESIFDLTGNKNPLLKALNKEITRTNKEIAAAKKAGKSTVVLQTELNKLLLQRKNLLEEDDKDTTGGTTLVDLFEQAQDILSGAGNVGFNTAGLQGLSARPRIQMEVQQRLDIVNDPAAARAAKQQQSTDRLIAAIDQLTNAITGNSSAGTVVQGPQNRNRWRSLTEEQRFYYQRQAKQMVEQGLVG